LFDSSASAGDFNGDGKNDMVVANYDAKTVSVLLNNADSPTSVESTSFTSQAPEQFALAQNYPKPFNPSTVINYELPIIGPVTLKVYDVLGKEIATLVNETKSAGSYTVEWNASKFASGADFIKLTANHFSSVRKMLMIK
jgi:hypothetical protein